MRYHRLGFLIPFTVAAVVTPVQLFVGDIAAREVYDDQPVKFAAMECVQTTSTHVTEYIYGRCTSEGVKSQTTVSPALISVSQTMRLNSGAQK